MLNSWPKLNYWYANVKNSLKRLKRIINLKVALQYIEKQKYDILKVLKVLYIFKTVIFLILICKWVRRIDASDRTFPWTLFLQINFYQQISDGLVPVPEDNSQVLTNFMILDFFFFLPFANLKYHKSCNRITKVGGGSK